ncbi:site-specific DNA-methyltransferase [Macrococcoides canis]|uniref:site-specific DNA-methyltransferase n=1 Tax=Macrococcoides canis TaxID=1855823 RepID=UPI00165E1AEC|nr:site-specific DNA-methyltransferase [Macrococcus canis]QNR07141.1 site-specific DNA-methyltransferase [Macrococcus canis]
MNKVPSSSPDLTNENIKKLKELFPEILTDGEQIDFDKLKTILGQEVNGEKERYSFNWYGKKDAILGAQKPSKGTLRPDKEKSKNFETTENLYIEGDNLEVLKLLQKSYSNKIKMIYIDPPYNTGKDFVYKDNFRDGIENYLEQTGQTDDEGNRLSTNSESNGRYHTDWLNMMYPRLKLARNLLADDGVIFISIDDTEQEKLKMICNEIFGESNFLACIIWERAYSPVNLKINFSENHDFILVYSKNYINVKSNGLGRSEESVKRYKNLDNDKRGTWKSSDLSVGPAISKNIYEITTPSGRKVLPPHGYSWRLSKDKFEEYVKDNRIWFGDKGDNVPSIKRFFYEVKTSITPMTIWKYSEVGHSQSASKSLKKIFNDKSYFSYPKPVNLIKRILELYTNNDSVILDFFSGSATTAHTTMQLNAEDGGNRKFIMAQLPEKLEEKSEAYKDGYRTICDIGEERIRRAGELVKQELIEKNDKAGMLADNCVDPEKLDIGFKVLKLDKSNIREWNSDFEDLEDNLFAYEDVFVDGRSELDIVYEIMLKNGLELTYNVNQFEYDGKNVYDIADGNLFVCLADEIDVSVAQAIVEKRNEYVIDTSSVVLKDTGFKSDADKLNVIELLKDSGYPEENILSI